MKDIMQHVTGTSCVNDDDGIVVMDSYYDLKKVWRKAHGEVTKY